VALPLHHGRHEPQWGFRFTQNATEVILQGVHRLRPVLWVNRQSSRWVRVTRVFFNLQLAKLPDEECWTHCSNVCGPADPGVVKDPVQGQLSVCLRALGDNEAPPATSAGFGRCPPARGNNLQRLMQSSLLRHPNSLTESVPWTPAALWSAPSVSPRHSPELISSHLGCFASLL
jgi:hypothetical protein